MKLDWKSVRQVGNRMFDPEGKYLNTKELGKWLGQEEAYLRDNPLPELIDFTKLNWKDDPDKVIELGGKYFRQSLLGSHAFSFATDVMKGRVGPVIGQITGTMTGIARIYCQFDDLLKAATYAAAGNAADGWDFLVERATRKLPIVSRQGLRFLNHVMTKEWKAKMFEMMTKKERMNDFNTRQIAPVRK